MVKHITPKNLYKIEAPRPRWFLHLQALWWRSLMAIGMLLHRLASPRPPKPDFAKQIPSTLSGKDGTITLQCYVPKDWKTEKGLWQNRMRPELEDEEAQGGEEAPNKGKSRRVSTALSTVSQGIRRKSQGGSRCSTCWHWVIDGSASSTARWTSSSAGIAARVPGRRSPSTAGIRTRT